MSSTKIREVGIGDLQNEEGAFEAYGFARLKVVRGDETLAVKVKIISVPQEKMDALRQSAPRPPVRAMMLDPTNPDHAALGVTQRQKGLLPDYGDEDYLKAKEGYDIKFRNEVVGLGVAESLTLKESGAVAVTPEERYKALEERRLSTFHFGELAQAILALTQWTEDERANFSSSSLA